MFFPYNVDVPMERVPIANWVLVGLTALVSIIIFQSGSEALIMNLPLWRGDNFSAIQLPGYALVHAGPVHLIGNMIFLFCFGNAINAKFGHVIFLAFYFAVAILTGLAWLAFGSGLVLVGASGAIMGVVGAFLILYPKNDVSVCYILIVRNGTFQMPSGLLIALYIVFDIWGLASTDVSPVAYICHVAGAVIGILVAVVLLKTGRIESTQYEQNLLEILKL